MELKEAVDTLIVIPNQKLLSYVGKQTSFTSAFSMVDDILKQAVCSISDLIVVPRGHAFMMAMPEVVEQCARFLREGRFQHEADS